MDEKIVLFEIGKIIVLLLLALTGFGVIFYLQFKLKTYYTRWINKKGG